MSSRRKFIDVSLKTFAVLTCGSIFGLAFKKTTKREHLWQIDPYKCVQCGACETACVLMPSAVKCFHSYALCGFCELCGGYHQSQATATDSAAENQLCPTAAIKRTYIEDPYYEYSIDEDLCIGCAKCVKGCNDFGNGSLFLQIRQDLCVNCNECNIARICPSKAIKRVPLDQPYLVKE